MKVPKYRTQSLNILSHLVEWGFPSEVQQRIGAFTVVWGTFESNLESTLWALRDENVAGVHPSTDTTSISQWIDSMAKGSAKLSSDAQDVLRLAALVAKDLMDYRHALIHGWLLPSQTTPTFTRNPRWNGELRKRTTSDAHIDENLLDLAIDVAWTLCRVVIATRTACSDPDQTSELTELKSEVIRVKSQANELRHLTALMNHEKY